MTARSQAQVTRSMRTVARRLAAARQTVAAIEGERDALYLEARDVGIGYPDIGAVFGVTKSGVRQREQSVRRRSEQP